MNTLPNAHLAFIPMEKLRDYALNPSHSKGGRDKARLFASMLGLRRDDAVWLRDAILEAIKDASCHPGPPSRYGTKYVIDMTLVRGTKHAFVRTAWLVPLGQDAPRLVSVFVLPSRAWGLRK